MISSILLSILLVAIACLIFGFTVWIIQEFDGPLSLSAALFTVIISTGFLITAFIIILKTFIR